MNSKKLILSALAIPVVLVGAHYAVPQKTTRNEILPPVISAPLQTPVVTTDNAPLVVPTPVDTAIIPSKTTPLASPTIPAPVQPPVPTQQPAATQPVSSAPKMVSRSQYTKPNVDPTKVEIWCGYVLTDGTTAEKFIETAPANYNSQPNVKITIDCPDYP